MADHADHGTAEHKHGTMDTSEHERTFANFIRWSVWIGGLSLAVLVLLAIFRI